MSKCEKVKLCKGCRDDFYNGKNPLGIEECWSLKDAKVVERWRIGWWVQQDSKQNFTKVKTLNCHYAPGDYAQYERLPDHLGGDSP